MKKIISLIMVYAIVLNVALFGVSAMVAPDYVYGDVNCDREVDVTDATYLQMHLVGLIELSKLSYELADFDGDTKIDITDATKIQMYEAKIIKHIPHEPYAIYTHVEIERVASDIESSKAIAGVPVTFNAQAYVPHGEDLVYPITYEYVIKMGDKEIAKSQRSENSEFTYTFENGGEYTVYLNAYNAFDLYSTYELEYKVLDEHNGELTISAFYGEKFGFDEGDQRVFTAHVYGGEAPYKYRYLSDGLYVSQEYSDSNILTLEPLTRLWNHEEHTVTVEVTDAKGNTASRTLRYMVFANLPA